MIDLHHEIPEPAAPGIVVLCDPNIYEDLLTADYSTGTTITNSIQSEAPEPPTSLVATAKPQAIEFSWSLGAFWTLNGITELWEAASGAAFGTATKLWEGRGTAKVITKADTTTRDYWVRMRTIGGQVSDTEPASTGLAAAALLSDTQHIEPGAATDVYSDVDDFAGTGFGNGTVLQSFTITPPVDCTIEVSGLAVADTVLGDSGNNMRITVQPTAGSETVLCGAGTNSATRQQHAYDANYAATGGVEITIRHKTLVSGSSIHVWTASLRLALVKR